MPNKDFLKNKINFKARIKSLVKQHRNNTMGIDLGTENTIICLNGKGIVLNEPSIISYINDGGVNNEYLMGNDAKNIIGKTPLKVNIVKPMQDGIISNNIFCEKMISSFISKVVEKNSLSSPTTIVGVPICATNVERRAVVDMLERCNTKEVLLVYESLLCAIGCGVLIDKPIGYMIIDIGGGTTDIAIVSLGGIIKSRSFKYGGRKMDNAIIEFIKLKYNTFIGENTAEMVKNKIGCLYLTKEDLNKTVQITGRDLVSNRPRVFFVPQEDIVVALSEYTNLLIENVKHIIEETPPELIDDVFKNGVILCGGCAQLQNIGFILQHVFNLKSRIIGNPLLSVAKGLEKIVDNYKLYKEHLQNYE